MSETHPTNINEQGQAENGQKRAVIVEINGYKNLPMADKRRIFDVFLPANLVLSKVANKLTEDEIVSAVGQFCTSAEVLPNRKIQIVVENAENIYTYTASKGDFIGAVVRYTNTRSHHGAFVKKQIRETNQ